MNPTLPLAAVPGPLEGLQYIGDNPDIVITRLL